MSSKRQRGNWGANTEKQTVVRVAVALLFIFLLCVESSVEAGPNSMGQTGIINMPTARIDDDGSLRFGLSQFSPYTTFWSSLSLLPRLELGARYTSIENTIGLTVDDNYGTFKDKAFDAKLLLIDESTYVPAISVGSQDFLGTRVFDSQYVVMSKSVGSVDLSLGYGRARIDGYFGGIEYQPAWAKDFSVVYEYDALDYHNERFANTSGAIDYKGGSSFGINYRAGWLGFNVAYQRGRDVGLNAYISIPLMDKEFIPKLHEPAVFNGVSNRATIAQWSVDSLYKRRLISALEVQGYKNVQILLQGQQLDIGFSHPQITLMGRAVGRMARTALLLGPSDIVSIRITYFTLTDLPLVAYQFNSLTLLADFFDGKINYGELLSGLTVSYADPRTADQLSAGALESYGNDEQPTTTNAPFHWMPHD